MNSLRKHVKCIKTINSLSNHPPPSADPRGDPPTTCKLQVFQSDLIGWFLNENQRERKLYFQNADSGPQQQQTSRQQRGKKGKWETINESNDGRMDIRRLFLKQSVSVSRPGQLGAAAAASTSRRSPPPSPPPNQTVESHHFSRVYIGPHGTLSGVKLTLSKQ